jgi:hypothetical protein
MSQLDFKNLDFDHLLKLAQKDPIKFEDLRQEAIDNYIDTLPSERQVKLRRLQWRIDQERRNRTPLSACIRISSLMWEHIVGSQGMLGYLKNCGTNKKEKQHLASCKEGNVVEFPLRSS